MLKIRKNRNKVIRKKINIKKSVPAIHAAKKKPPAPVRVPGQRPLAPSVTSVTSVANGKGDNEMIPGAVDRSPGIWLIAEENSGKLQFRDRR